MSEVNEVRNPHEWRLQLVRRMSGIEYTLEAECSHCGPHPSPTALLDLVDTQSESDNDEPDTIFINCPTCENQLPITLWWTDRKSWDHMYLPTRDHVLRVIGTRETRPSTREDFEEAYGRSFYHATMFHCGSLVNAFAINGITCDQSDVKPRADWREAVITFLGKLPNKVIAQVVGVREDVITSLGPSTGSEVHASH